MKPRAPKERQQRGGANVPKTSSRPRRRRGPAGEGPLALSSGQAARYCLVSSDTIANWIGAGRLTAQRTAGGQYRIRLSDLRCFMRAHGMRTDLLDEELGAAQPCWEFWSGCATGAVAPEPPATCAECPVYRARAVVCHEVRPLLAGGPLHALTCADCGYFVSHTSPSTPEG